jgi:hypothetical protein
MTSDVCPPLPVTTDPPGDVRILFILGRNNRSSLLVSAVRTREMFVVSKTVAAEMGNFLLKNDRSRTRIARLIGGRNMADMSLAEGGGFEAELAAMELRRCRACTRKGRNGRNEILGKKWESFTELQAWGKRVFKSSFQTRDFVCTTPQKMCRVLGRFSSCRRLGVASRLFYFYMARDGFCAIRYQHSWRWQRHNSRDIELASRVLIKRKKIYSRKYEQGVSQYFAVNTARNPSQRHE